MERKCKCGGGAFVGIEYPVERVEHYKGISEWECMDCGTRYGRWSYKELKDGEYEKRWGE